MTFYLFGEWETWTKIIPEEKMDEGRRAHSKRLSGISLHKRCVVQHVDVDMH